LSGIAIYSVIYLQGVKKTRELTTVSQTRFKYSIPWEKRCGSNGWARIVYAQLFMIIMACFKAQEAHG